MDNIQIPIAISTANNKENKLFTIDHVRLKQAISNQLEAEIDNLVKGIWLLLTLQD